MAYLNTHADAGRAESGARSSSVLATLRARFNRYRTYRKTLSELSALSHRELADLGLQRSEIRRIAWQAAYN